MTSNERKLFIGGVALGAAVALAAMQVRSFILRPGDATPAAAETSTGEPATEGATTVELSGAEQRSIGVQTVEVRPQTIRRKIQTTGRVEEDETGMRTISARTGGRIEKLSLKTTGEIVKVGQAVAFIGTTSADPATGTTIYSSANGTVMKRSVVEGQYVKEGDELYSIADLSRVWVQADIFESDISMIRVGQTARISSSVLQAVLLTGTVSYLKSSADPDTRTIAARVQIENPQGQLRPGMFVQVSFDAPLNDGSPAQLAVPRSAVLDTGNEKVVYIARGEGVFEKRSVVTGAVGDEFYSVTKGLQAGDRVVTHGNFLLDSQTRLTGNITGMFGGSKAFGADAAAEPAGTRSAITFKVDPSQPKGGAENTFHVTVADPAGKPVTDAQVQVMFVMPAMPSMGMGEMRSSYTLKWNGSEYIGTGTISMAGPWNVSVDARRGNQTLGSYKTHVDAK
jgi:Cu(I)/Ag(I) efflux system membrane fusion protein/cobalt-zinc-cadmium efflux system membrane fusion protein